MTIAMKLFQLRINRVKIAIVALFVVFFYPTAAFAYLDPGTGSAVIQGLIAALAAIGLTLKVYWHRVLGFLGLRRSSNEEKSGADGDPTDK
jgi:hypothetical protein